MMIPVDYSRVLLRVVVFILVSMGHAAAQTSAAPDKFICYNPVGKMPELLSGGGMQGIVKAIQQKAIYPSQALRKPINGKVFISFTVLASGIVAKAIVVKGLRADYNAAALLAVKQLPRLSPGNEQGKAVPIMMTVPITFYLKQ